MTDYLRLKKENYKIIEEEKKGKKVEVSGYPYWLTIDPANYCNLSCPLCPTGQKRGARKQVTLSMGKFKKVIDCLGPYLIHMDLCNWGEPLLNKKVVDMIKYAKKFFINVKLDTNINILNESSAQRLIESGLDKIILSIDGASQESYLKYRRGGDFKKAINNLQLLVNKKMELSSITPFIEWQFLVFRHNEHEISIAKKMAEDLGVDEINFTPPYAGSLKWLATIEPFRSKFYEVKGEKVSFKSCPRQEICNWLWDSVVVNSNGSVSPCCSVENSSDDFFEEFNPLSFNFNHRKYKEARERIVLKKDPNGENKNICLRCEHWGWSNHMDAGFILSKLERRQNAFS